MPNIIYGVWWVGPTKRRLGQRAGRLFVGPTHQTPYIILGMLLGILLDPLLVYYWTDYWYIINGILLDPLLYPLVPYPLPLPR